MPCSILNEECELFLRSRQSPWLSRGDPEGVVGTRSHAMDRNRGMRAVPFDGDLVSVVVAW